MIRTEKIRFQPIPLDTAAMFVVAAEQNATEMGFSERLPVDVFANVRSAIERRRRADFEVNPNDREEVVGLVSAVLSSDGLDHLIRERREVIRYVVGLLQTDKDHLERARTLVENGAKNL